MKKVFTFSNIQAVLFLALSVGETVLMICFKPYPLPLVLFIQFAALMGISAIRFAYPLALWGNRCRSRWSRKHANREDDEPSDFAVGRLRMIGYGILFLMQAFLFL